LRLDINELETVKPNILTKGSIFDIFKAYLLKLYLGKLVLLPAAHVRFVILAVLMDTIVAKEVMLINTYVCNGCYLEV